MIEHRQALGEEAAASSGNGTSLSSLRATKAPTAKDGQAHSRRRPPDHPIMLAQPNQIEHDLDR